MAETTTVPPWDQTTVSVSTRTGPATDPAITHPWCPGLAVTMHDFGRFRVTHLLSGMSIGATYERASNARVELAEWAVIGRALALAWDAASADDVRAALQGDTSIPVPFGGATTTTGGVTRPMTVNEWLTDMLLARQFGDEFPWEGPDDDPAEHSDAILATLTPAPAATTPAAPVAAEPTEA